MWLHLVVAILSAQCGPAMWSAARYAPQEGPATPADAGPAPTTQPEASASTQPAQTSPSGSIDPELDELLTRLEASAADLRSFTANIKYQKEDDLTGTRELRSGELLYRQETPGTDSADSAAMKKSFAILFQVVIRNGSRRDELQHFIFDGRWLIEINHKDKTFIKREIVPPGQTLDPLKLGEGPFPLPVGQPKAEILARFNVSAATVPTEGLLKGLSNVQGVTLTPRPGTRESEDYQRIELFYDQQSLLPVGIIAVEENGDVKTVRLENAQRNVELTAEQRKKLDVRDPDNREWKIIAEPWSPGE